MGGKFGGVFNLVIWQSGEKILNFIPPILNPHDSGQLADRSSTHDYALHQHALEDSCIPPRECDIGYSSLSGKEFRVANEHALGAADLSQCPYKLGPQSTTSTHWKIGQGWEGVSMKLACQDLLSA